MKLKFNYERKQAFFLILLASLATHGLILLNQGVYWDGWINFLALTERNWDKIYFVYAKAGGIPLSPFLQWPIAYSGNIVVAYRIGAFLSILWIGWLQYNIGIKNLGLDSTYSLLGTLLALTYPGFQMAASIAGTLILIYVSIFITGLYLTLNLHSLSGMRRIASRLIALALFALSFRFEALLLFLYSLILIDYSRTTKSWQLNKWAVWISSLKKHIDFVLLPITYWIVSRSVFPLPLDLNYNQLDLSNLQLSFFSFLDNLIVQQFVRTAKILLQFWPLAFAFLILSLVVSWIFGRKFISPHNSLGYIMILALGMLVLAALPFSLVGKDASPIGFGTRHSVLLSWPLGLLLTGMFCWSIDKFPKQRSVPVAIASFLILAFMLSNGITYLTWQARWAKDQAIIKDLRSIEAAEKFSVFLVEDNFSVPGLEKYRFYEWAGIFRMTWGDESHVGFQIGYYSPLQLLNLEHAFIENYNTSEVDLHGCYARLEINPGSYIPDPEIGARYLFYKFVNRKNLSGFLGSLVDTQVSAIDHELETNCVQQ